MSYDFTKKTYEGVWVYEPYFALLPSRMKDGSWKWLKTVALVYEVDIEFFGGTVNDTYLVSMESVTEEALRGNREIQTLAEIRQQTK